MSEFNIRRVPVEITGVSVYGRVDLKIGGHQAVIIEPKAQLWRNGLVYLSSTENGPSWSSLVRSETKGGTVLDGCTDDPRLLGIAEKVISGRIAELSTGTTFQPLE